MKEPLWRRAALGVGAFGAAFALIAGTTQALEPPHQLPQSGPPAPAPVSAASVCFWSNPEPRYGMLPSDVSHAEGEARCRNTGPKIKVRCQITLAIGPWYLATSSHGTWDCSKDGYELEANIGRGLLHPEVNDHYGSRFIFWLTLRGRQYAWDGSLPGSENPGGTPNRGCRVYQARVTFRSTMRCRHIHHDGVRYAFKSIG